VLVAAGTWTAPENRNLRFLGRDVVRLAPAGPEATVIGCEGEGHGFPLNGAVGGAGFRLTFDINSDIMQSAAVG
jgi:hypothetical protein